MLRLFFALLLASLTASAADELRPNIVLIFMDDMGYGDIGPFGSTKNRTPNLDRMAREGMKLTSFYAAPVCSVSRAQVLTGCYGQRVSIPGVLPPASHTGINPDEHTVAELMKAQGYATMCIGKWHLGDQPDFFPTRHGFDHYFGLPYSNDMMRKPSGGDKAVVPLIRDEKVIEMLVGPDQDRLTERYTDEAIRFITENKARPFFLYLPHTAVHVPVHPGEKFRNQSKNGVFGDWVEEADWSVGRVLDTLRDLKLAEKTLVVFTSDNGPWLSQGKNAGEAGPLRGGKGSTWEGGVREPTLAWWPGKIAADSVCDAVAGAMDFLPTFVKLAGGTVPADRKIDGADIAPLLLGTTKESPHEARYYYQGYKLQAVRSGPWKLAIAPQNESMGMGQTVFASMEKPRLYNLDAEIGERTDVAAEHPEVVAKLKALAEKMAAELGDGKPGPAVRPAGFVKQAVMLSLEAPAAGSPPAPQKQLPIPGEAFLVAGHTAFIIPGNIDADSKSKPWVLYAPTLPGLPGNEEKWMFEQFIAAGIAIAGIDVGESYGSPEGRKLFTALHDEMTGTRGYSAKPVLLGRSRGGLMTLSWAAENPGKVAAFAGIYPVCDIASYPGIAKAAVAYGMTPDELRAHLDEHNPVARLAALAKARVPLFAIHGDADKLVPLAPNSATVKERYTSLGGTMELIIPAGQGHSMWEGFFRSQSLVDFVKKHCGR